MDTSKMSLVDPAWEYLDPTPDIFAMFHEFDKTFFGCTMGRVELKWSKRMTSCAGLMAPLEGKGGACSIRLSEPLLKLRPRKDLVQTLLHEMIHAHLHVTKCRESDPHGPKFKEHMHRINKIAGTNITVYHNFHDEVNLHKQHWWRCNGPCRNWRPYYGWVKRATNRAPSKNDFWWAQHQHNCGGQYIKVKEPEGYSQKKQAQLKKSLGKNGNLLSMIKKKYNFNHPVPTVNSPKLTDMWKKKQTNVTSSKTPLKTNNSSSPFQTKSPTPNSKNTKIPSSSFSNTSITSSKTPLKTNNSSSPFLTKSPTLNSKNTKIPSSTFSNTGTALGTSDNPHSMNSILGQLHKENLQRRRQLSGKKNHSIIGHETKIKNENHTEGKPICIDLTESPSVSSKNNKNSSLISKKSNSLIKQVTQDSEKKSPSKVPQSSIRDFGKALNDKNLYDSKRSFLSNKVDFIEKNVKSSFKSQNKPEKSNDSFSSPKKNSSDFSPTSKSSHQEKKSKSSTSTNLSSDISGSISSPKSDKDCLLLTKNDTATSLLLLKKKRKRLLSNLTDSSDDDKQMFSSLKSEKQSWTTNSDMSSRLNPDFFSLSSYKEKKPLLSKSSSSEEKKSFSLNNSGKQTSPSSSDSSSSLNKDSKPLISNLNTSLSSLCKERKISTTNSSSSLSPHSKDRKYSPTKNSSFPINKERKTIQNNTSSSHVSNHKERLKVKPSPSEIPIKRHCPTDSSPSHSSFKQKKVSHTESNSSSKDLPSLTPTKKYSFKKLHSSPIHSDKSKTNKSFTFVASPSPDEQDTPKKKGKIFAQLFDDDSDSEVETDKKKPTQILKYPSSSSSAFTSQNTTKSQQKSTSGSRSKKPTSTQIHSNRLENYFSTPIKESPKDDPIIIDNYTASSSGISQSKAPQSMVPCPVCQKKVPETRINNHLDECLNMNLINENS